MNRHVGLFFFRVSGNVIIGREDRGVTLDTIHFRRRKIPAGEIRAGSACLTGRPSFIFSRVSSLTHPGTDYIHFIL